jgi:hypothetical protein
MKYIKNKLEVTNKRTDQTRMQTCIDLIWTTNLEIISQTEENCNVLTDFDSTLHRRMQGYLVKF